MKMVRKWFEFILSGAGDNGHLSIISVSTRCKMRPNNAEVLLGSDWMVISEDEGLQKVIKMTKGKDAFQRTFSRVRSL